MYAQVFYKAHWPVLTLATLTVSRVACVVLDSSVDPFFPVKTLFRFFLTSLLRIQWKKKMQIP